MPPIHGSNPHMAQNYNMQMMVTTCLRPLLMKSKIRQKCRTLLYYGVSVDPTMLVAVVSVFATNKNQHITLMVRCNG